MFTFLLSTLFSPIGLLIQAVIGLIYYYNASRADFFKKREINYISPVPFFGNMFGPVAKKVTFTEHYDKIYNKFPTDMVVGMFEFLKSAYMVKDPELIKQIQIKEFDSFVNHRSVVDAHADPIFGRNLFMIKDQRWREMRTILSPAFTGAKMRFLFELIRQCAQNGTDHIVDEAKNNGGVYEFEAKDLFTRCANDVIATSAFGIEVNSIKDKTNEFYTKARQMTTFTFALSLKLFLTLNAPKILDILGLKILDKELSMYFRDIVLEAMKLREQNKLIRPDIIQLLLQAKTKGKIDSDQPNEGNGTANANDSTNGVNHGKQGTIKWTDDDLVAQSILFFFAGFETTSALFSFMSYELAKNPDVQDRLREEVDNLVEELEGKDPTYEDINNLKYLEQVMNETLRLWPPTIFTDRMCTKTVNLVDAKGKKLTMNPGDSILVPIHQFHRDPKFFPNPEKFDPDRFSDENKGSINQFIFQPFGLGPRQCIGNRFAMMECKIFFFYLISKLRVELSEKSEETLTLKKGVLQSIPVNGMWLQFRVNE